MDYCRYFDDIFNIDDFNIFSNNESNINSDVIDVEFTETIINDEIVKM